MCLGSFLLGAKNPADLDLAWRIYLKQSSSYSKHHLQRCFKMHQALGGCTVLMDKGTFKNYFFSVFPERNSFLFKAKFYSVRFP
jgi:hypothetical protein